MHGTLSALSSEGYWLTIFAFALLDDTNYVMSFIILSATAIYFTRRH
jgi:hypothetical protein